MESRLPKPVSVAQTDILDKKKSFSFSYLTAFYSYVFEVTPTYPPCDVWACKTSSTVPELRKMIPMRLLTG